MSETPEKNINELYAEARERFACDHSEFELRKRIISRGGVQYVNQCLHCGEACSQPLARLKAVERNGGVEPPAFDDALFDSRKQERSGVYEQINALASARIEKKRASQSIDTALYRKYLRSEEWANKRRLVLLRAQGICEGCRLAEATAVHHLTYLHIFNEFLFELVALCEPCHYRIHQGSSNAS